MEQDEYTKKEIRQYNKILNKITKYNNKMTEYIPSILTKIEDTRFDKEATTNTKKQEKYAKKIDQLQNELLKHKNKMILSILGSKELFEMETDDGKEITEQHLVEQDILKILEYMTELIAQLEQINNEIR